MNVGMGSVARRHAASLRGLTGRGLTGRGLIGLVLVGLLAGCATNIMRPREESHCRAAMEKLGEWTGEKGDPAIESTVSAKRVIDGKQVSVVNISYRQGGTGRLITCTYDASGKGPAIDVIYKNVHLTEDDLKRLNAAVK